MTSMPWVPRMIRLTGKFSPPIYMGVLGQNLRVSRVEPGICILICLGKNSSTKPPLETNSSVTKEWVAPESNRTVAGTELTRNVPSTTSGASWASAASMWLRRPLATATLPRGAVFLPFPFPFPLRPCPELGAGALGRGAFLLGLGQSQK